MNHLQQINSLQHPFQQFDCGFVGGVVSGELAVEGAGEDGFFDEVDFGEGVLGNAVRLLFFGEQVINDADDFCLLVKGWQI